MNFKQTGRRRKVRRVATAERILKTACLFFCVVGILTVTFLRSEGAGSLGRRKKILITAHRGASHGAPENTKASVVLAIEEGADYAEIDVRLTADGIPVLMHDRALFRTVGMVNEVDKVTYEELTACDVGIRYGAAFAGERVPGLKEVLEDYGKKIRFNIELKDGLDYELAQAVVKLIEELGLEERCVITSDSYEQLEWIKENNEKIRTGYILGLVYGEIFHCDAADFFSVRSDCITEQMIKNLHARGKEIHAWTVNQESEIKRMQAIGVDNIITDKPAYVREIIQ